ncbi:enoyl-CoA hydratase/isomerase family protein [Actinophytocola sp.]|uniref:enoyl-CoA hydratase/isomerase family protein n=1 Tax=Actinophytocola sp. TaxID=1872138 RepID=UPI003D6ABDAC
MTEVRVQHVAGVATITIDRPATRNAISLRTIDELGAALAQVEQDDAAVVVLRGSGDRAFVSGGDLKDFAVLRTVAEATVMADRMRRLLDTVAALRMPTIAALNGHALGGGAEVALACDLRVAAADVTIAFNQSQLAIMPAWGGLERLVDLVGRSVALRLLLTGERLNAADATDIGLVDLEVPRAGFQSAYEDLAARIAAIPPTVSRSIKAAVDAARPNSHPALASDAVGRFARLWADEEHWVAVRQLGRS